MLLAVIVLFGVAAVIAFAWFGSRREVDALRTTYKDVIDAEETAKRIVDDANVEAERIREVATHAEQRARADVEVAERQRDELDDQIARSRADWEQKYQLAIRDLDALTKEVGIYNDAADLQSFGLYRAQYEFADSDGYKERLEAVRADQAKMLKEKTAAICIKQWTVEGSAAKGRQMTDRNLKLMLRAFNGDCDASIAKTTYRNVASLEERIRKAFDAINKLGEPNACELVVRYRDLKLAELRLAYEYEQKLQDEREELREQRERQRDEEIALRQIEKAKKEAEADLRRREIALAQARAELAHAHAAEKIALEARVLKLEGEVTEAQTREVQLTQAQLTRHGTVYIICNIGSFGEGVLKVGLTRRLDPDERVTELGDASVPFLFDVLAYIESDDAPALEARLHKVLEDRRVNLVNRRKEFFHATLDEVMAVVNADASASRKIRRFTPQVEAREFRQTQLIRAERTGKPAARSVVDEARERFENMRAAI